VDVFPDERRVAESAPGRVTCFLRGQTVRTLLLFFQFEVRLQFSLKVSIAFPNLPPFHLSSPRLLAT
jgi:hypothetical protein